MILTIHGLPLSVKYHDLKVLVKQQCNITDFALDNLTQEGDGHKKVQISVSNERDGLYLMKSLDEYRYSGHILRVMPMNKPMPMNQPQQNLDQRGGYPQRNNYPNQAGPPDYNNRVMDPWGQNNQWTPNQSVNQQPQSNYNYQPGSGMNQPYGQQGPTQVRPAMRPYDQRDQYPPGRMPLDERYQGYPAKDVPEPVPQRRMDSRSHVLRSVEIIDEPLNRPTGSSSGYQGYDMPQKPITIMKDNFQGPQYNVNRPNQPGQYQGHSGPGQQGQGHSQSSWDQSIPPGKIGVPYDRKYPDHDKRQTKDPGEPYNKPGHGPRFSPRRDIPKDGPGPRFSPRRDVIKDSGPRFSPRRDIPKDSGPRFSPRRDIPKDSLGPRFSPRRDIPKDSGPRFSPRRDKGISRFSPRRDVPKDGPGPRFSPRRDVLKEGHGPRFSPRKDVPRFSPRRDIPKEGHVPRFSPRRDKEPRFSPRRDVIKEGHIPGFMPRPDVPGRRDSPPGRRVSPPGRRISPPGRRVSPPGRRVSPPGRRVSPPGRRVSPPGRRVSPTDRHRRETSPGLKRVSPGRRESPRRDALRYSPSRRHHHHDKPTDKYALEAARAALKEVRPAYEPPAQAPNQAMYSGGYRPNIHENIQYPVPGMRQPEGSPWSQDRDKTIFSGSMKKDEDRRETRMPKFEPRVERMIEANVEAKRSRSPRKSRSPVRRDRSPLRDRYKKHSPSPRSPRRSWALEKRRSPDAREAPPPPLWPGQNIDEEDFRKRASFKGKVDDDKGKRPPVWADAYEGNNDRRGRRPEEEPRFPEETIRVRTDLLQRQAVQQQSHVREDPSPRHSFKPEERFPPKYEPREREPKFEPREDFPERRPDFRRADERLEFRNVQREREDHRQDFHSRDRREEFPRREERKEPPKVQESFQKEFDDIYKRAMEFNKKAQEIRKTHEHRKDDFPEDRRREEPKDFDRNKFQREGDRGDTHNDREDFRRTDERRDESRREQPRREEPRREETRRDAPRRDEPRNDSFGKREREPEWKVAEPRLAMNPGIKAKRDKAVDEIAERIMNRHGKDFSFEMKERVLLELKIALSKIMKEMFGNEDVSFIEMVIKFNAKYDVNGEIKIMNDVVYSLPSHFRNLKRTAEEPVRTEMPAKTARHSLNTNLKQDVPSKGLNEHIPERNSNVPPPTLVTPAMPYFNMVPQMHMIMPPAMVPAPSFVAYKEPKQEQLKQEQSKQEQPPPPALIDLDSDANNLYLCKDDFEPYSAVQAEYLKKFLVSQIIKVSVTNQGWAPDFTIKGLQSLYRYELEARNERTRNWILNLDFSNFSLFNVLVYTKEELWYERAAIWLPGHSRCHNIEPLTKLKLQNKRLKGVNIGKWKLVKKIVTIKGTRVYVDMPPSSARALEKNKMLLSYELQKVNVFLKAVAVDKDAFDAGLKEFSIKDQAEIIAAAQNSPMPSLGHEPNIIKIALKGNKALNVDQARKIKEMIIYHIFKHHQDNDYGRTDFLKYGFVLPGYFGVVAANNESKKWLTSINIGKFNGHAVVVLGADETTTKYIRMVVSLKNDFINRNAVPVLEKLKQSNQGVKGLNFNVWKTRSVLMDKNNAQKLTLEIDMDVESVETIVKMKNTLDYVDDRNYHETVSVKSEYSSSRLKDILKKYKSKVRNTNDVANMEIASSEDEDDDIVFKGKLKTLAT